MTHERDVMKRLPLEETTPAELHPALTSFGKRLGSKPIFVDVDTRPGGEADECYATAMAQAKDYGGSVEQGWLIWENPGCYFIAVHHAVWKRPDQSLLDVAFHADGEGRIVFVPDPNTKFEGQRILPKVVPILLAAPVLQFVQAKTRRDALYDKGMKSVNGQQFFSPSHMSASEAEQWEASERDLVKAVKGLTAFRSRRARNLRRANRRRRK